VASNKVSATSLAYLSPVAPDVTTAPATLPVTAGGAVVVTAVNSSLLEATTDMKAEVSPTNDAGAGIINGFIGQVLDSYQYTSNSGTRDVRFGDRVLVPGAGVDEDGNPVEITYQWMGSDALGAGIDLGAQDYTDFELWKELTPTNLITESLTYAVLSEVGTALNKNLTGSANSYFGLIAHNDVRSVVEAFVRDAVVTADSLTVEAWGSGGIMASDSSAVTPWEGAGAVIVTNTLLAEATASVTDSTVTTTGARPVTDADATTSASGDVVVRAVNDAALDATATSTIEAWEALSAVAAFNSIGWKPQNLLFNALDAILGDPLLADEAFDGEQPAGATAILRNTTVLAGGDVIVEAISALTLNATAGNENVVEAAIDLLFTGAQTTTKSTDAKTGKQKTKVEGYGASGLAGGGILASNKGSSRAEAVIEFTGPARGTVTAGGEVIVLAADEAGIDANSTVLQDVATSNDLSGLPALVSGVLIPGDYDFTTKSGTVAISDGDRVRLGAAYAGGGTTGAVYRYDGADAVIDLGTVDYATGPWTNLSTSSNLEELYPGIGNFTDSDARAVGVLVVMNDLRSAVEARITNATVTATAVAVTANENAWLQADAELHVSATGGSFYGSGTVWAGGGQIATNVVLAEATATIANSAVTATAGDVLVETTNDSGIDATVTSSVYSGDEAVGITLAFNSVGWESQNILFNTIDAILGDPLLADEAFGGEQPSQATAEVTGSTITAAAGALAVLGTIILVFSRTIPMVMFAGVFLGLGTGTFMASNWALGTDLVPQKDAGRYLGISNLAGAGAGIIGSSIGGPLADYFNAIQPGLGYPVIFALYGGLFLLSVLLLPRIKAATALS